MEDMIRRDVAYLLALLDSDAVTISGQQAENLASGKMLLRGILDNTVRVEIVQPEMPPGPDEDIDE